MKTLLRDIPALRLQSIIFAVAALVAIPVRCYQYFNILEESTGFYSEKDWSVWVLYVLLGAALVSIWVIARKTRAQYSYSIEVKSRPVLGAICFLLALTLLWDAVYCCAAILTAAEQSPLVMKELYRSLIKTGILPRAFEVLTAGVAAVYFFILGLSYVRGKSNGMEYRVLGLAPVLWGVARIILRFTRTISFVNISDLFYELIMLALLITFLMTFAQLTARVNFEGMDWKIPAYAFPTALLCLVCFVPRLVVTLMGRTELLSAQSPLEPCDFAITLFVLATVFSRIRPTARAMGNTQGTPPEAPVQQTQSHQTRAPEIDANFYG